MIKFRISQQDNSNTRYIQKPYKFSADKHQAATT